MGNFEVVSSSSTEPGETFSSFTAPLPCFANKGFLQKNVISMAKILPSYVATQGYNEERIRAALTRLCQKYVEDDIKKIERAIGTANQVLLQSLNGETLENVADEMIAIQPYYLLQEMGN